MPLNYGIGDKGDAGSIPGLGRSPEEKISAHFSILAWGISWTEEPGGLQSMGLSVWLAKSQTQLSSWFYPKHRFYPKEIVPSIQPFDGMKRSGLSGLKKNKKLQIISHCLSISWCLALWWEFILITGIKNRNNDYLTPTLNHLAYSIYLFYITLFIFRQPHNIASTLNVW